MYFAVDGAWTLSFGTTRKKFGIEPFVSDVRVADPEMNASRSAFLKIGATASTSWLPAGPMTARTLASAWSFVPVVEAWAGSSCVSCCDSLILPPPSFLIAYCAKPSVSLPMNAASPVIGPWNPIFGLSQPALATLVAAGPASARANAEATIASDATMSTANAAAPFRVLPCIPCPPVDCTVLRRRNQFRVVLVCP